MTIDDWVARAHGTSVDKGWWDGVKDDQEKLLTCVPEKLMLIVTEVAEAMEDYRVAGYGTEYALIQLRDYHVLANGKPVGFSSELMDILIRVLDLCGGLGIDVEATLQAKCDYNDTRSWKHGGKRA